MADTMFQRAPWPTALEDLVAEVTYKAGWSFALVEERRDGGQCAGLSLHITAVGPDSYHPERQRGVTHVFIVPAATYDRRAWQRWMLDQVGLAEDHERCEFFQIGGERPYAPNHGAGRNPYVIHELGTAADAATRAGQASPG